jgi:hypothetical protein|tara:strand:+ start:1048 stop:1422 length:375 start_codon:yes stop_codon:yes gene_type:complete
MAHFAKIENNIVTNVIVAEQEFIDEWHSDETWVQTSYNTRGGIHYGQDGNSDGVVALRGNYAGIGYTYDTDNDVFYTPQPYASWTLDETVWQWVCPLTYPDNNKMYHWDEDLHQSDNTKGWVEE